jgi:hypothetical protein
MVNGMATTTASNGNIATEGSMGVATSSPAQELGVSGDVMLGSAATTSIIIDATTAATGGCIQLEGSNDTIYRLYVNNAGNLVTEAGSCQ